jgi:trans-aconitate 2-methyltransferase
MASWSPEQYNRFRRERMQPFEDLVGLISPAADMRILDLGCGTGELSALLAERFPGSTVHGIDTSPEMLAKAEARVSQRVTFAQADIAAFDAYGDYDLVFSNAAFQWVPDNEGLMQRILTHLKPGAQLAVQMPKNDQHISHRLAAEIAQEEPFASWLGGFIRHSEALSLERYAEILHAHGMDRLVCTELIYGHELGSSADVVEWVKGTLLTAYLGKLSDDQGERYLARYKERLLDALGEQTPYFYAFRRMLLSAGKPVGS